MALVIDARKLLGQSLRQLLEPCHEAAVSTFCRQRSEEFLLQLPVLRQCRTDSYPASVGRPHDVDQVHWIAVDDIRSLHDAAFAGCKAAPRMPRGRHCLERLPFSFALMCWTMRRHTSDA